MLALFSVSASWGSCISGKKNNYSIHRSRNTFKLLFLSKIKVENNHWDHEFQFRECLQFLPFQQVGAVAFLEKKTINLSTVLGIPSINFSNQRSKLKLTRVHMHFRSSSFGNACTFFRFSKLGQLRFWKKKTINLSTVLGIPSINFYYQRSKLKLTRVHRHFRSSSFGNACTFFRFSKLGQMRFWKKKTINLSTVLGIPSSYFSNQR